MLVEISSIPGSYNEQNTDVSLISYSPYYTDVTPEIQEFAKTRLGEHPETRTRGIYETKENLKREVNLNYREGDAFLLKFLRCRKFNSARAASLVVKYYTFLESYRPIFDRHDPTVVKKFIEAKIVTYLPYRDHHDRAIILFRAGEWDVNTFNVDDVVFGGIVSMKSFIELPINQIKGFVVICDFKNLSLKQILTFCPRFAFFASQGLQYCCPCLVPAIHFVNVPEIFRVGWNTVKSLLSEKIRKRITFHTDRGLETLHDMIPKAILPEELGGDLGPIDTTQWATNVDRIHGDYQEEISYGYKDFKPSAAFKTKSLLRSLGFRKSRDA